MVDALKVAQGVRDFLQPVWHGYHTHNGLLAEGARYPAYSPSGFLELASALMLQRTLLQTTGNQSWRLCGGAPALLDYTGDGAEGQGRRGADGRWHRCLGVMNYAGEFVDLANGYDYTAQDSARIITHSERRNYRLPLDEQHLRMEIVSLRPLVDGWMHERHARSCTVKQPGRHYRCTVG